MVYSICVYVCICMRLVRFSYIENFVVPTNELCALCARHRDTDREGKLKEERRARASERDDRAASTTKRTSVA